MNLTFSNVLDFSEEMKLIVEKIILDPEPCDRRKHLVDFVKLLCLENRKLETAGFGSQKLERVDWPIHNILPNLKRNKI